RVWSAVRRYWRCWSTSRVTLSAPAEDGGVRVQDFPPMGVEGDPYAVVVVHRWGSVEHDQHRLVVETFTDVAEHAVFRVVGVQPFESFGMAIALMQRRDLPVQLVELAHQQL